MFTDHQEVKNMAILDNVKSVTPILDGTYLEIIKQYKDKVTLLLNAFVLSAKQYLVA